MAGFLQPISDSRGSTRSAQLADQRDRVGAGRHRPARGSMPRAAYASMPEERRRGRATGSAPAMTVFSISAGSRPDVVAVPVEHLELVGDLVGVGAEQVAGVGVLRDEPQRLPLAAAADQIGGRGCWIGCGEQIVSASW